MLIVIKEIRWEKHALDQLDNIIDFIISTDNLGLGLKRAIVQTEELFKAVEDLYQFPEKHPIVQGLNVETIVRRMIVHARYEVRYVIEQHTIRIIAVYHVKQTRPPHNLTSIDKSSS